MKYQITLILIIIVLSGINACGQITKNHLDNEKITGKWKAVDSVSFRGKKIEFLPGYRVILTTANGAKQSGEYEINDSTITFSIGDAHPFNMIIRFERDNLILITPGEKTENRYMKKEE
jgi:hypothetical protein